MTAFSFPPSISSLRKTRFSAFSSVEALVSADLLTTIKQQAEGFLKSGYKDAAAVACRIMLESALKKICDVKSIKYSNKVKLNTLNDKLKKQGG